jgi:truncated hemoglobin YjbI/plastocyanin
MQAMVRTTGLALILLLTACPGPTARVTSAPRPAVAKTDEAPPPEEPRPPAPAPAPEAPPPEAPPAPPSRSLYERLGGKPMVAKIAAELSKHTTTDPRIKERFFSIDPDDLRRLVIEFMCAVSGGPCEYTGRDMKTSHARMDLVQEEVDVFVEGLAVGLDRLKVPEREKRELLDAFNRFGPDMVASPDKLRPIPTAKLAPAARLAAALPDKTAATLLSLAVQAGQRGQRSYAEQLFSRAELLVGGKALASVAEVFRSGAPPRVTGVIRRVPDAAPQPRFVGSSDVDEPDARPPIGWLRGALKIDGQAPTGLGVVMLWPEKGAKKRQPKQRVIEQRNKSFAPHLMAVPVGSRVSFPNFDPIFHNVFSLSKTKPFDLGMYKNGETREIRLDKPGIVRLGCNIHANMSAYVIVVDAPHYVVVDTDGTYSFKSLPPGKYRVQAWNEQSAEPMTTMLTIHPGANEGNFELRGDASTTGTDKFGTPRR